MLQQVLVTGGSLTPNAVAEQDEVSAGPWLSPSFIPGLEGWECG